MASALVEDLEKLIGAEKVLSGTADRRAYNADAYMIDRSRPSVVVLPSSTGEAQSVIRYCLSNDIPYVPRGAGTGLSGGSLAAKGGVMISTKRLTSILKIEPENRRLLAQTGVVNQKITDVATPYGLHFAPDPSSQTVSTLGGNIGENSGGPHTLKYGVTANHILSMTLIDGDGDMVELGNPCVGGPGYDVMGLVTGGEGTLGFVTEAWVRLTPIPSAVVTALAAFPTPRNASEVVAGIIATGVVPSALEMVDQGILFALTEAFGFEFHPEAKALLLVETDGESADQVREEMEVVRQQCVAKGCLAFDVAQNEAERKRMWMARKKGVGAMGRLAPTVVTHDGVIPRSKLPEMLDFVYQCAKDYGVNVANIFHAGDGNLHPCFYFDDRDPKQIEAVLEAGEAVIRRCLELGGSLSGEHGIGVEKADLMLLMFDPNSLALQLRLKELFNPSGLCNPCKIIPNQKGCSEHKGRWRGSAW